MSMTGHDYSNRIAAYVVKSFGDRGITVYREVAIGMTIIGKRRRVDVFVVHEASGKALAIECKYQASQGTADEKIPYTLRDVLEMGMPACVVYAGDGFSAGIEHMLAGAPRAARCLPGEDLERGAHTFELDAILAMTFGWWDLLVGRKKPFEL